MTDEEIRKAAWAAWRPVASEPVAGVEAVFRAGMEAGRSEAKPKRQKAPVCAVERPPEVDEQTWADWLALRIAKKAAVTQTVLNAACREATKAGMTLEAFLRVWCYRGSQGLEADWLKPHERVSGRRPDRIDRQLEGAAIMLGNRSRINETHEYGDIFDAEQQKLIGR